MLTFDVEALRRVIREELAAAAKSAPVVVQRTPDAPNFSDQDLMRRWKRSKTYVSAIRRDGHMKSVRFGSRWITPLTEVQRIEAQGLPSIGAGGRPKQAAPGVARAIFGAKR